MKKRHEQKLVILSLSLLLAFTVPFILIFNKVDAIFGIPVLYLYIFIVWLIAVIIAYRILSKHYE